MKVRGTAARIALIACSASAAWAAELSGVALPDQMTLDGKVLVLNGMGVRKAYGVVKVYVAGLYLETKTSDPDEILGSDSSRRIELRFVREVEKQDIAKAWTEGFEKNAGGALPALAERLDTLNRAMPDLHEKDSLAFTSSPGKGVVVEVNGKAAATIPGGDFAKVLFAIWLGPQPPNAALKEGLLGRK